MQKEKKLQRIAWKLSRLTSNVASVRYRCLLPAKFLENHGVQSTFFQSSDAIDFSCFDAIVFVKCFTEYDYHLAQKAQASGVKVFLDICDNLFFVNHETKKYSFQYKFFLKMAEIADKVFCPTEELKSVLAQKLPVAKICVLPDPIEEKHHSYEFAQKIPRFYFSRIFHSGRLAIPLLYFLRLTKVASFRLRVRPLVMRVVDLLFAAIDTMIGLLTSILARLIVWTLPGSVAHAFRSETSESGGAKKIRWVDEKDLKKPVIGWFGNSGTAGIFGLSDLQLLDQDLQKLCQQRQATLLVVSDSPAQMESLSHLALNVCFVKWDATTIYDAIDKMDVVVLPNRKNEFSICKSPNRAVFSLLLGKPVVLTSNQSNEFLGENVQRAEDWFSAVSEYLDNPQKVTNHVEGSRRLIFQTLAPEILGQKWFDQLSLAKKQQEFNSQAVHVVYP